MKQSIIIKEAIRKHYPAEDIKVNLSGQAYNRIVKIVWTLGPTEQEILNILPPCELIVELNRRKTFFI